MPEYPPGELSPERIARRAAAIRRGWARRNVNPLARTVPACRPVAWTVPTARTAPLRDILPPPEMED